MSGPTVALVQARMGSTRLPGKVLMPIGGRPVLSWVCDRARRIPGVDLVCVAAPDGDEDEPIAAWAAGEADLQLFRGDRHDVLARLAGAARETDAARVLRITADCPLLDPEVAGLILETLVRSGSEYAATAMESGWPIGLDVEAVSRRALEAAHAEAGDAYEREHATAFLWRRPERFPSCFVDRKPDRRAWRLAIDTREDMTVLTGIAAKLSGPDAGFPEIEALLLAHPSLLDASRGVVQHAYCWSSEPS